MLFNRKFSPIRYDDLHFELFWVDTSPRDRDKPSTKGRVSYRPILRTEYTIPISKTLPAQIILHAAVALYSPSFSLTTISHECNTHSIVVFSDFGIILITILSLVVLFIRFRALHCCPRPDTKS